MACRTPAENVVDSPNTVLINKKIVELKKKILLAGSPCCFLFFFLILYFPFTNIFPEGQKKAYIGEWSQKEKQNSDNITELKKEIKELTSKVTCLNNIVTRKLSNDPQEVIRKISYPPGAKSAEDAVKIYDLKVNKNLFFCNLSHHSQ